MLPNPVMVVTVLDALRCSKCDEAKPEEDFLLCDGCVRGFHAHCLNQDMPDSRFWFCPVCAGTTIKGCLIKALESAGHIGLTAAELNAQVLLLRTKDSDEAPLPPEVVAMYNKTTVTERSRLCRGAKGRLEDGRPLVEKLIPSPTSLFRYRLAPEHPSLAPPSALPVQAPELQPEVINPLSDSEDAEAESEGWMVKKVKARTMGWMSHLLQQRIAAVPLQQIGLNLLLHFLKNRSRMSAMAKSLTGSPAAA
ncbi:hypothetical protein WJX82_007979 [Trebouxia sp. C0006]